VLREGPLRRDRSGDGVPGPMERHQERIPLSVDLLTVPFIERSAEQAAVFLQNLHVPAVAEALEERSGTLDVGEEEGDRPGRQSSHERPPWARMGR
jgi:hypothetical protein